MKKIWCQLFGHSDTVKSERISNFEELRTHTCTRCGREVLFVTGWVSMVLESPINKY